MWSSLVKWSILRGHYDQEWTPDCVHGCIQLYTDFYRINYIKWIILLEFKPNTQRNIISFQLDAFLIHVINKSWPNKVFIHIWNIWNEAGWSHCLYNKATTKNSNLFPNCHPKKPIAMAQANESPPNCEVSEITYQKCEKWT